MNILAIGAHPDDVKMNCAGTLARCADAYRMTPQRLLP
jgi:LmbE family N-acetylglucosaminyl deacetylase